MSDTRTPPGMRKRELTNPSRDGRRFVRSILTMYVKDMINERDYESCERELLDVIRGERRCVLRALRRDVSDRGSEKR